MTSVSRKIHSRRRLAALTFLSNISLDGTHRDTNLGELTFHIKVKSANVKNPILLDHRDPLVDIKSADNKTIETDHKVVENVNNSEIIQVPCAENLTRRSSECSRDQENFDQLDDILYVKNKVRVQKFVSEAKARLCNLSQKRRLSRQKSIDSYGLPSANSTESLTIAGACRSRKASLCPSELSFPTSVEVKFIRSLKEQKNESERIVLVSEKKSPFMLYSVLSYSRLQGSARQEVKLDGSRRRHASSMRQLVAINDGPDPFDILSLLGVEKPLEGQEISYGELLAPTVVSKRSKFQDNWPECDVSLRFPYQMPHNIESHIPRISPKFSTTPPKATDKFSERENTYHPYLLDDPELIAGKHSTLLVFPSYITSVIDYVKPSDLKKDLNDRFREKFPFIQLTFSKMKSVTLTSLWLLKPLFILKNLF